jgi:putative transposase
MGSYRQILYHLIFNTWNKLHVLPADHRPELFRYIGGIVRKDNCVLYEINGVENHIHMLTDLHPSLALADLMKDIKVASSKWIKTTGNFPEFSSWAEGYGALTYAWRDKQMIANYIRKQVEHHKKVNFIDEYRKLLEEHGVEIDAHYFL